MVMNSLVASKIVAACAAVMVNCAQEAPYCFAKKVIIVEPS